jgi:hypothetical protein
MMALPRSAGRGGFMSSASQPQQQPQIQISQAPDYREGYANSVQIRVSVWDFLLSFGTMSQNNPAAVQISNFQSVYLSPQQAKALWNVLGQNVAQYESTFGEIKLDPRASGTISIQ